MGCSVRAHLLFSDNLRAETEPLLSSAQSRPKGARRPIMDRVALASSLFVLHSGLLWKYMPQEGRGRWSVSC